jgi:biopolymer transport protein ExbD
MAGFAREEDDDEPIAQINIIPFVDIALVLLVVFLLTANLIAKASIVVDLPRAANGGDAVDATANVVVTAQGDLYLDGAPTTRDALASEMTRRVQADPRLRSVVAADRAVRYERVVDVIDVLKAAGVAGFSLDIERAEAR